MRMTRERPATDTVPDREVLHVRVVGDHDRGQQCVMTADVVSERNRYYHDSEKLAAAVMRLYSGRNQGPPEELVPVRVAR